MTFSSDLNRIIKKTNGKFDQLFKFVCLEALNGVVELTPVDEGRLRGNWQVSKGSPASGTLDTTDKSGAATKAKGQSVILNFGSGDVAYVVNNLPYAKRIEYGYSRIKAPKGMVRITAKRIQRNVNNEANRLNRK